MPDKARPKTRSSSMSAAIPQDWSTGCDRARLSAQWRAPRCIRADMPQILRCGAAHEERYAGEMAQVLPLLASVDAQQAILEFLGVVLGVVARFNPRFRLLERREQFGTFPFVGHRNFFHGGDGYHGGSASLAFGGSLRCHGS